jgi:two-component system sensor histidine kinase BaeS
MKIHNKLFLMLFSFSLLLVTALVILMQWSIGRGMIEYVNTKEVEALLPLVPVLQQEYQKNNDWTALQNEHKIFGSLIFKQLENNENSVSVQIENNNKPARGPSSPNFDQRRPPRPNRQGERPLPPDQGFDSFPPRLQSSYALLDKNEFTVAGHYLKDVSYTKIPIVIENENVGYLVISKNMQIGNGYELDFIQQQQQYLWIIALITMLLVALLTFPLARHLVQPIKLIMNGMHKLTQGQYNQHIEFKRKDEIGDLIRDFNELSITLDKNENARKRWLANISHELRTPVAILRGELEAMIDKVRPLNKQNIESANDEVKHLQYLIDDLHQLTSADIGGMHYRKKNENLPLWLKSEVKKYHSYLSDAGIKLELDISNTPINVFVDTSRLCQLFDNLINNCIKYAQASLVKISLAVDTNMEDKCVIIKVEDNGVGVSEKHLINLFEYLYRVEDSRNRKTGGSGLGLSICAHIVVAHQGKIIAEKSKLGGLAIVINLPYE